jgi:hypothetical protein
LLTFGALHPRSPGEEAALIALWPPKPGCSLYPLDTVKQPKDEKLALKLGKTKKTFRLFLSARPQNEVSISPLVMPAVLSRHPLSSADSG